MKGEHAVLTIPIDLPTALDILQTDAAEVELVASTPGADIRLTFTRATEVAAPAAPAPPVATATPQPKAATKATTSYKCDECGRVFANGAGLGGHRKIHGRSAKKPATPKVAAPAEVTPIDGRGQCGEDGCSTRLSTYNKSDYCSVHEHARRLRGLPA